MDLAKDTKVAVRMLRKFIHNHRSLGTRFAGTFLAFLTLVVSSVNGQTIDVGSSVDFNSALQTVNSNPGTHYTLNFLNGFTIGQLLPAFASNSTVMLTGNSKTIDGASIYQPLTINSGTVSLQSLNLINTLPVAVNAGKLVDNSNSLQGLISNQGIVEFHQTGIGAYSGNMSGAGSVAITGGGAVIFSGINSYTGGTTIDPFTTLSGTTSSLQGSMTNNGFVQFNQSTSGTYAGNISGTGSVQISGTGPITFTGTNSYLGGTYIDGGSRLIGTTGSLFGSFANTGTLEFQQATAGTFAGGIDGSGSVEITGAGPVTFSGTNTYTGGTSISAGSSLIGVTTALQGSITNNGSLKFDQSSAGYFLGSISGSGSVEFGGGGTLTLMSPNSYTGGTTVDSGTTVVGTTSGLQGSILNNGAVKFNQSTSGAYGGNMTGTGNVDVGGGSRITFSGTNSYSGGTTIETGTTLIGSVNSLQGAITNNGAVEFISATGGVGNSFSNLVVGGSSAVLVPIPTAPEIYSGNMSGTGSVKVSNLALRLTGSNSYSGGTRIDSGSYLMGTTSSLQGNMTNNGNLIFDQSTTGTFGGNLSGSGAAIIMGGGTVTFSGTNDYSGGTFVSSGSQLIGSTGSLTGTITSDGAIRFDQSSAGTFAGKIIGDSSVRISGVGPVTFTGANSYSGGTSIDSGSMLIGNTQSLKGSVVDNGTLQFNQTTSGTFSSVISGSGRLEVNGVGPLTLSKANTFTGGTTIKNGGTLVVASTGSLASGVTVSNGGTLKGSGTVQSTVVNAGGTINPGTPGSALTIHGNLTQAAGSTYAVGLGTSASDEIHVTGTAQVASGTTLNLLVDSSTYTVGHRYEILSAAGGLNGAFTSVVVPSISQNVLFNQEYDANHLQLVVNSNLVPLAQSPNQANLATAIDQASGSATGDYADAITQLTTLNSAQLSSALNQISADIYPSLGMIQRQVSTMELQLISNRLASLTRSGIPSVDVAQQGPPLRFVSQNGGDQSGETRTGQHRDWTGWAQGFGLGGNLAGDGSGGGTNYRLGGTLFGLERWLSEKTMVGVLGGYTGTTVKDRQNDSTAQVNGYQAGLYQLHRMDNLYLSNIDSYNNTDFDVNRPIQFGTIQQTATGKSGGNQWSHYTEAGTSLQFDDIRLQPFLGLQYLYLNQRGLTETVAGGLGQTIDSQTVNSFRNSLGFRLSTETSWGDTLVVPFLSARYQHEWGNGTSLISSSLSGAPTVQFVTAGSRTGRDFGSFTLGLTAYLSERFQVYGSMDAQVASRYSALIGTGGIQYAW